VKLRLKSTHKSSICPQKGHFVFSKNYVGLSSSLQLRIRKSKSSAFVDPKRDRLRSNALTFLTQKRSFKVQRLIVSHPKEIVQRSNALTVPSFQNWEVISRPNALNNSLPFSKFKRSFKSPTPSMTFVWLKSILRKKIKRI